MINQINQSETGSRSSFEFSGTMESVRDVKGALYEADGEDRQAPSVILKILINLIVRSKTRQSLCFMEQFRFFSSFY